MVGRATVLLCVTLALAGPAGAATALDDFARCLTKSGATYFRASWCPHCKRQQKLFGSAIRWVHSVDCSEGCAGVASFPTWRFGDGSLHAGFASLELLASRTRCQLQSEGDSDGPGGVEDTGWEPSGSGGARERTIGGAKIIEVPGR